jgi:hypothetical protein
MKGAICNFCGRRFSNAQAVRAHLKACPAYGRLPKARLPRVGKKPRTVGAPDSDPGVRSTWEDVPPPTDPRPQPSRIVARNGQKANTSGLARWMIQSVKEEVLGSGRWAGHTIPSEIKAQALVAIDQELSSLPVEQLPRAELVTIAEGIRDRLYRPAIQAQQRAREEEERRRQQARQRTTLIASGVTHANQALRQRHALDIWTRLDLEQKVKRALEQAIDGSESEADLPALVDKLLAQQLEPLEKKRRDTARPRLLAHGVAYLRLRLALEDNLNARERLAIERDVTQDLEEGVTGEESTGDVETFVDEVLDDLRGETEENDEEDELDDEDEEEEEDEGDEEDDVED